MGINKTEIGIISLHIGMHVMVVICIPFYIS
ncbi:MAG: hypothetical protein ACJAS1_007276 [Oleiphilaceae bacterium]